jgi:gliding motility-associated-like protein
VQNPIEPVVAELIFAEDGSNPNCAAALSNVAFTQVAELPNAPVLVGDTICSSSGPISIGVASAPGLDYSWSPTSGLSNPNISNPTATLVNANLSPKVFTYTLTASNETCSATDTVNIVVVPAPRARFLMSPDPASTEDPVVFFLNKSIVNDNTTFFWDFAGLGVSTARDPQFRFPQGKPGIYDVTLTTIDQVLGCADEYVDQVTVKRELLIYVPNAFTPDADGKNDIWGPVTTNIDNDQYHLMVFDRTGQLVFETRNVKEKWNGGLMNGDYYLEAGVYVWKIVGKEVDARDEFEMNGIVTMLR